MIRDSKWRGFDDEIVIPVVQCEVCGNSMLAKDSNKTVMYDDHDYGEFGGTISIFQCDLCISKEFAECSPNCTEYGCFECCGMGVEDFE